MWLYSRDKQMWKQQSFVRYMRGKSGQGSNQRFEIDDYAASDARVKQRVKDERTVANEKIVISQLDKTGAVHVYGRELKARLDTWGGLVVFVLSAQVGHGCR